jgi:hypothetical protein
MTTKKKCIKKLKKKKTEPNQTKKTNRNLKFFKKAPNNLFLFILERSEDLSDLPPQVGLPHPLCF